MDLNKFTIKSQEAITQAQANAIEYGHIEVDGEHLLLAMVDQPEGVFPRLLSKLDVNPSAFREALETELHKRHGCQGLVLSQGKYTLRRD